MWCNNLQFSLNPFPHILQGYGLSLVCILRWLAKLLLWLKFFSHTLQEYSFSPVWVLMWRNNLLFSLNLFSHVLQEYNFITVCFFFSRVLQVFPTSALMQDSFWGLLSSLYTVICHFNTDKAELWEWSWLLFGSEFLWSLSSLAGFTKSVFLCFKYMGQTWPSNTLQSFCVRIDTRSEKEQVLITVCRTTT